MLRGLLLLGLLQQTPAETGEVCALTQDQPKKPRYLKFCQDYNSEACCIPGHDLENQIQFELLIDGLGPGCKNPMMYPNIRYYYCLGCDYQQPRFTTYNPEGSDSPGTIRICKAFVEKLWLDYRDQYKECGVMQFNACPEGFDDFDPYTCGDDLIIPPVEFGEDLAGGLAFMNQFAPPGLYDYQFVMSNDSDTDCWQPPFMRSSAARVSGAATLGVMLLGVALRHLL